MQLKDVVNQKDKDLMQKDKELMMSENKINTLTEALRRVQEGQARGFVCKRCDNPFMTADDLRLHKQVCNVFPCLLDDM